MSQVTAAPMRVLIVDDEPLARARLRQLLDASPEVVVVDECGDGREAVARLARGGVDVVFLDVQMPELDGFGVVRDVGADNMPVVVFVTAHDAHALRAFEHRALDYLLKPVDPTRFTATLERARLLVRGATLEHVQAQLRSLLGDVAPRVAPPPDDQRLAVSVGERVVLLPVREIEWVEADGSYVRVHSRGRAFLMRETLNGLEARLDRHAFVRVHRSRLVNASRVRELEPLFKGEYVLMLDTGAKVETGRTYRDTVRERFGLK